MSVLEPMLLELNTNGYGIDHKKAALQNRWKNLYNIDNDVTKSVTRHTNQDTTVTHHHGKTTDSFSFAGRTMENQISIESSTFSIDLQRNNFLIKTTYRNNFVLTGG